MGRIDLRVSFFVRNSSLHRTPTGRRPFVNVDFFVLSTSCTLYELCHRLDIMYQLEEVHFLVDEMVQNGYIVETNKTNILRPIALMERESAKAESMFR